MLLISPMTSWYYSMSAMKSCWMLADDWSGMQLLQLRLDAGLLSCWFINMGVVMGHWLWKSMIIKDECCQIFYKVNYSNAILYFNVWRRRCIHSDYVTWQAQRMTHLMNLCNWIRKRRLPLPSSSWWCCVHSTTTTAVLPAATATATSCTNSS